jgi:hypothetical protein
MRKRLPADQAWTIAYDLDHRTERIGLPAVP